MKKNIVSKYQCKRKELNYEDNLVTTFFGESFTKSMIQKNVDSCLMSKLSSYAPKIVKYDLDGRYMIEELVFGSELNPKSINEVVKAYNDEINPILSELICADHFIEKKASEYYIEIHEKISKWIQDLICLDIRYETFEQEMKKVLKNLDMMDINLLLVPSHGDFKFKHVFVSATGPKVIDWETFGRRSFLLDFLNPFSGWVLYNECSGLNIAIKQCLCSLIQLVSVRNSQLSRSLHFWHENVSFAIICFYMERILRLIEVSQTDIDTKRVGIERLMNSFIIIFNELGDDKKN